MRAYFKLNIFLSVILMIIIKTSDLSGQEIVHPTLIKKAAGFAISGPLRNNPVVSYLDFQPREIPLNRKINPNIQPPDYFESTPDIGAQKRQGQKLLTEGVIEGFAGQNTNSYPPDANGDVNDDYYFQVVNLTYTIFDKSDGSIVAGPSALNTIFDSSLPGASCNDGDPVVLWDEHASRWFYAELSLDCGTDYILIAVSTSSDPTGTWYSWSFDVDDLPDYPKFGIWKDGYYMATNTSNGNDIYVFERSSMIAGDSNPAFIGFDNPNRPSTFDGFHCILPLDNDGPWAPTGTPGQFITIADDDQGNPSDALYIYELAVDWSTPSNSTFSRTQTLSVNSFSGNFNSSWNNIPQPETSQKLDGLSTILMHRAQYRNFNGTQKIVCTHTIAESENEASIRWYELENTGSGWDIAQQGTYNPDNISRWCASIAMNDNGEIAMGYSVSDGSTTYPGIRFCGQSNSAPSNTMDITETTIWTGDYSQTSYNRWGDYANISVDPDGETFWFTSEYMGSSTHGTRIASFRISSDIIVDQKREDNSRLSGSYIGKWSGISFTNEQITSQPITYSFTLGDIAVLKGDQTLVTNPYEKYNRWIVDVTDETDVKNHHTFTYDGSFSFLTSQFKKSYLGIKIENALEGFSTVSGGNILFKDPWFIDYPDPDYGNNRRNRGMDNSGPDALLFRQRTSPLYPNNIGTYEYGQKYNGVFLNQSFNSTNPVYYSVQAISPQDIPLGGSLGTRKFYFYNWSGTDVQFSSSSALETGVVFTDEGAEVQANFKGHLLSNDQNGISSGSQRKLVRTDNGIYHLVYESLGSVWYTHSLTSNFNGSWSQDEEVEAHSKNPSIDFEGNTIKIVCETTEPTITSTAAVYLETYIPSGGTYQLEGGELIVEYSQSYFGNAKPVIAYDNSAVFIAYRKNSTDGIYQKTKWYSSGSWNWGSEGAIPNTISSSKDPSVASKSNNIYLTYEHSLSIKYIYAYTNGTSWIYTNSATLSTGSGFDHNHSPSISVAGNGYPVVSWVGYNNIVPPKMMQKGNEVNVEYIPKVVVRRGHGTWSSFFKAGNYAVTTNNNSVTGSQDEISIISWSEGSSPNYSSKWVRRNNGTYTDAHSISDNGIQNQVSNGTSTPYIEGVVFSTTTTPYNMSLTTTNFAEIFPDDHGQRKKSNYTELCYGREGVVYKNGIEFLFNIGDVIVADSVIRFIEQPDTLLYSSAEELNQAVKTEPFYLNQGTEFYFTNFYYVLNRQAADTSLTDADVVNFKAELINEQTGEVAGTFDNVTYTKEQLAQYNNISYQVDCSNISPCNYYLRLVTDVDGEAKYFLGNVQNSGESIDKRKYNVVSLNGVANPESYELSQNYPNPFNPTTTIKYQIPEDGMVTLNVYDILGKEIKTLVNEQKTAGRYEVKFDASDLATGVYLYRIKVNDFVSVKKMLLVK